MASRRSRLRRGLCSGHVKDLKIIGLFGAILIGTIAFLLTDPLYYLKTALQHEDVKLQAETQRKIGQIKDIISTFTVAAACSEGQSFISPDDLNSINDAHQKLVILQDINFVDVKRWDYISIPLYQLAHNTDTVHGDIFVNKDSNKNVCNVDDRAPETSNKIKSDILRMTVSAKNLAAALSADTKQFALSPILVGFFTGIITFFTWIYRTSDSRLTHVDMIAGEIYSVCRTIVNNRSADAIAKVQQTHQIASYRYLELEERYDSLMTSVGANLGFLNQSTITRIMGFYTSLKIMRDRFRMLKNWALALRKDVTTVTGDQARYLDNLLRQIMFDLLLCVENARIALHFLLEDGDFHDDCIFICLMSELRILIFLRQPQLRKLNGPHLMQRLYARLGNPQIGTHEEFESYWHPVYADALMKARDKFQDFYGDEVHQQLERMLKAADRMRRRIPTPLQNTESGSPQEQVRLVAEHPQPA